MYTQESCFLLGLCLLGGVTFCLTAVDTEAQITAAPDTNDKDTPQVQPLQTELQNDATESKSTYTTKEANVKTMAEIKKKPVMDFKARSDQKYQKPIVKDDDSRRPVNPDVSMTSSISPTTISMKMNRSSVTTKIGDDALMAPFLIRGAPMIAAVTKATPMNSHRDMSNDAVKVQVTDDTTSSSRSRALNISAPEPTNSLYANITDLSDVSMDEDDKEVEGGEYVVPHNETAINISSDVFLKELGCSYENHTYSIGEKFVRGCEEKCVCSESGIDCRPVCNDSFIKASEEIDDIRCEKHIMKEEPCCALLVCESNSGNNKTDNETCVFGNKTIARKQRVEDGCSRVCICEDDGHLKCQPRCPPNETTTTTANQHDRCVTLPSPSDLCCTITYCDVTLGDHEIKSENSTDLNVHLMDIKVLNSTAVKVKLSAKKPEDVVVEISQNNHVWRQQKTDKDGIISNLEPARTYYIRMTEGSSTGPAVQVILPAEVMKTNMSEKMSDKNSCYYKGKSYKIGAEWYDDCVFYCSCLEGGAPLCSTIKCPTDFGLDLLNPDCLDWETVDFVPKPPRCCPEEVVCRNDGSCNYEGVRYKNWSELPKNVTGCENQCHCEMGKVSCQAACPAVPALPPPYLPCASAEAKLTHNPNRSCCLEWTCNRSSSNLSGVNVTTAYSGPLATNTFDRQTIDNTERLNNRSGTLEPSQESEHSTFSLSATDRTQTDATAHGPPHYPMDPGYPTVPYSGPYNPDFISSHPAVEDTFHLSPHTEKPTPAPREKSKLKSDSKKPVELTKPYKEVIDHFPGPLSPDRFPQKLTTMLPYPTNENQHVPDLLNSKEPQQKDHPTRLNSENIPPVDSDEQLDKFTSGPSHRDTIPVKPDTIKSNTIDPKIPEKKPTLNNPYVDTRRPFPTLSNQWPGQDVKNTKQEILPYHHLYHLIDSQHPGSSIQLDHTLPQDYSSLYDQISNEKQPPNNRAPPGYFETLPSTSRKAKPHIFAQKDETGQVTYHIHTPNIPHSPQQIEELLEYINQHHTKSGSFQHYPEQSAVPHNIPSGSPPLSPPHTNTQILHSGFAHLNLPFAAQTTSNQSGAGHDIVYPGYSGNIPGFPAAPTTNEIIIQELEALDEHTVRLVFTVPQVLVGLHGRVELRYTSDKENYNLSTWKVQIFVPPNDLITTPQLEFELGDLKPSTKYSVKITVKLRDLANSPTSKIYSVRTLDKPVDETILPPQIPVDTELQVVEVNSTWINVMWKKFTEYELQFIDGVQLRYKEHDTHSKIYSATPLIHRAVTNYVIENLKPSTTYEVGIYFIPFPGQMTELRSEKTIEVTTSTEPDPYSFEVKVEIKTVKSTDVEVSWSGVPYPEDKYVNIYRAIYQSDTGKEDTSTFKIAKRDSHAKTVISDLKPGTRYRLWLEVYLTNGRIKKSNVQDFVTKPGVLLPATVSPGKFTTLPLHEGDYYGPLVIVAIVASLAILSTLILLMMLMKRRTSSKADISPRKTTSAYDNPSYKTCEDVVTISNGRNKTAADHEMVTVTSNVKETV